MSNTVLGFVKDLFIRGVTKMSTIPGASVTPTQTETTIPPIAEPLIPAATGSITIPVVHENILQKVEHGFTRFIDTIGADFVKSEPAILKVEGVAQAAEVALAFTPFGPEYDIVVNAVTGIQKTAYAAAAAGVGKTDAEKFADVLSVVTGPLTALLNKKGVTTGETAAITQFVQSIYGILAGPAVAVTVAK